MEIEVDRRRRHPYRIRVGYTGMADYGAKIDWCRRTFEQFAFGAQAFGGLYSFKREEDAVLFMLKFGESDEKIF